MQAAKQIRLSRNARRSSPGLEPRRSKMESIHRKQKSALRFDRRDVLDGRERLVRAPLVGDVGVEQGQVELDVHRLLEQLPRQVQPRLGALTCW